MRKFLFFVVALFVIGNTVNSQVSYWKFEDNANDETGTNNGTLVNGDPSLYVAGVSGKAIDFGAGTDTTYVEVPDDPSIDFDSTQSFSVSLFLKVESITGGRIFVKGSSGKDDPAHPAWNGKRYEMYFGSDGSFRWTVDDDVTKSQLLVEDIGTYIIPGDWNHLVGVRDRADSMLYLYINGQIVTELDDVTFFNIQSPGVPLIIGKSEYKNGDGTVGLIDEFQIYNKALTPTEIKDLYISLAFPDNLAAYWKLDGNANDALGTSDGTLIDGDASLYVDGHIGKAINMGKGVPSSYIEVPDNPIIDFDSTTSFTISFLIKDDDFNEHMECVFKGATGVDPPANKYGRWYALYYNGPDIRMMVDDNMNKTQLEVPAKNQFVPNRWNHVVGVRDLVSDSLIIYLNGQKLAGMEDITEGNIASSPLPLIIGNSHYLNNPNPGILDEIRLYDTALSATEINDLYRSYNLRSAPEGVVAYWKLDGNGYDALATSDGTLMDIGDSLFVYGFAGKAINMGKGLPSSYIEVPDNPIIDFDSTASFTISFLIKDDDFNEHMECVFKGATGVDPPADKYGRWYALYYNGSDIRMIVDDNMDKSQLEAPAANKFHLPSIFGVGGWNLVVGVRDRAKDSMYIYLNGERLASMLDVTEGNIASSPLPLIIGNSQDHNNPNPGILDEIRLYNIALSAADVVELATSYGLEPKIPLSNDATLSDLQVDGSTIDGFSPLITTYDYPELPAGTSTVPTVTATATDPNATVDIAATDVLPGTTTVTVTAEDGTTVKPYVVNFTVETTGIYNLVKNNISVYPIPVHDVLIIDHAGKFTEISIYDVNGALIYSQLANGASRQQINVSELSDGTYIIKAKTAENEIFTGTFLKQ